MFDELVLMYRERVDETGKKFKRDINASAQLGRRHVFGSLGTLNTISPCAACKLLRRRCAQECPFSPYFSPHEPHKFACVHKVFGASNVSKLLMVPECQRAEAANSLVYEASIRLRDPVYGCMGAISALQQQVQFLEAELNLVRSQILRYKFRDNNQQDDHHILPSSHDHLAVLSTGAVSIAAPPPPLPLPRSSSSSTYTLQTTTTTDYSTITSDNISYFA
ncbi:lateral organ boundaries domain-containing protein [Cynara cardunculus var. scolymus]|uniref:Lateral organ boundaries domain-containing protein n=1 Tax=Cynara cardunculus var. scolymus TaxID=59895 RepID=A0A103YDF0_CYNCS|nr:lateral organ boundaries domain-containing protein [Cynara cardunculus var. scolymus]